MSDKKTETPITDMFVDEVLSIVRTENVDVKEPYFTKGLDLITRCLGMAERDGGFYVCTILRLCGATLSIMCMYVDKNPILAYGYEVLFDMCNTNAIERIGSFDALKQCVYLNEKTRPDRDMGMRSVHLGPAGFIQRYKKHKP